jgi:hypothetical protein
MKKLVLLLMMFGLMGLGCVEKQRAIPPRPPLTSSVAYDNGTIMLSPTDSKALLLYIIQLEEGCK